MKKEICWICEVEFTDEIKENPNEHLCKMGGVDGLPTHKNCYKVLMNEARKVSMK